MAKNDATRAERIVSALYKVKGIDDGAIDKTALFARMRATADAVCRADDGGKATDDELVEAGRKMLRGDNTAELKDKVIGQGGGFGPTKGDAKAKKDGDEDGNATLADIVKLLGNVSDRLDKLETKRGDNGEETGKPEALAADAAYGMPRMSTAAQDAFAEAQSRADKAYSAAGAGRAPAPMSGEGLLQYRRRLLMPLRQHSKEFAKSDLRAVAVADPAVFASVEDNIYVAAADAAKNPATVPLGHLRAISETRNGHTYTRFYGAPASWISGFAGPGRRVKRINRYDSAGNVSGAAYSRE